MQRDGRLPLRLDAAGADYLARNGGILTLYRPKCSFCTAIYRHGDHTSTLAKLAQIAHKQDVYVGVANGHRYRDQLSVQTDTYPAIFITTPGGSPVRYNGERTAEAIWAEYQRRVRKPLNKEDPTYTADASSTALLRDMPTMDEAVAIKRVESAHHTASAAPRAPVRQLKTVHDIAHFLTHESGALVLVDHTNSHETLVNQLASHPTVTAKQWNVSVTHGPTLHPRLHDAYRQAIDSYPSVIVAHGGANAHHPGTPDADSIVHSIAELERRR